MKLPTQAAIAALAVALLASPAFAQTKQGPLPPTGSASDYQAPSASSGSTTSTTQKSASTTTKKKSTQAAAQSTSRQDYLDQAAKRFDAMDANHDGTLTIAERRAYNSKIRASTTSTSKSTAASKSSSSIAPSSGSRAILPPVSTDTPSKM
jgi:hypothetical protein